MEYRSEMREILKRITPVLASNVSSVLRQRYGGAWWDICVEGRKDVPADVLEDFVLEQERIRGMDLSLVLRAILDNQHEFRSSEVSGCQSDTRINLVLWLNRLNGRMSCAIGEYGEGQFRSDLARIIELVDPMDSVTADSLRNMQK